MPATAPDIFSLVPVLLALVISISLRNVIFGLFVGLFAGVLMIEGPGLLGGMSLMVRDYLVPQVTDSYNAGVLVLLGFIGGGRGADGTLRRRSGVCGKSDALHHHKSAAAIVGMDWRHRHLLLGSRHTANRWAYL